MMTNHRGFVLSGVSDIKFENNFVYPLDGIWTHAKKAEFLAWRERCGKDDWRYNDQLPWMTQQLGENPGDLKAQSE